MDRAVRAHHQMGGLGEQAGDCPQLPLRAGLGEDLAAVIGPARQIGLGETGFDLAAVDLAEVLDRSGCRLRHRNQAGDAASAAMTAGRAAGRSRDGGGDDTADFEEAAAGRRRADSKKARLGCRGRDAHGHRQKQTGAGQAAPAILPDPDVRLTR